MKCAVQIYMVLGGFHVYKSVFWGWVVGRFNIAVNGEHNCGVLPIGGPQGPRSTTDNYKGDLRAPSILP